jgi:hypothetical protein
VIVPGSSGAFNPVFSRSIRPAAATATSASNPPAAGPSVSSEGHLSPTSASATGDISSMSEEQIARLHGEILYILQNEGQDTGDQENIVDDSLFGDGDDETVEVPDDSVPTVDVDESETSGTGTETGGVLFEYLKSLIEKIKKDIVNFSQPECYRNGTFWHRPHDAIFALEASRMSSSGINPQELYHRDVFIWLLGLPKPLPGEPEKLHCPTCLRKHGKQHYLMRKGWLY